MFYHYDMGSEKGIVAGRPRSRGAETNRAGRFERLSREPFDDGWEQSDPLPPLRTEITFETPKRVITRNNSPDVPFDRSINPYRGCEHGCVYCFARPTHAFLGLSPGLDFETRLTAKPDAPSMLAAELSARSYSPRPIALGTNTDPYQPIESELRIMRGILKVLRDFRHPVTIVTKGALIERDIDLLSEMAADQLIHVGVSVTTLDPVLSRRMEPRAPSPPRRIAVIGRLVNAGVPVRVMVAPVVPALTDHELEAILTRAKEAGAEAASWVLLRLPLEVSGLFREWLHEHLPERAARVIGRVRETHGGADYDPAWGKRMRGEGAHAMLISKRFDVTIGRLGLTKSLPDLRCDLFRVPPQPGEQLSLFDP